MVRLELMTQSEFDAFFSASASGYARANVESGRWAAEGADERAQHQLRALLPEGMDTADRWVFKITIPASDEAAGYLFFAAVESGGLRGGYIYDFEIYPAFRRRGYAQRALTELDAFARSQGLPFIDLHVFGDNAAARALYDRQGYTVKGVQMRRALAGSGTGD